MTHVHRKMNCCRTCVVFDDLQFLSNPGAAFDMREGFRGIREQQTSSKVFSVQVDRKAETKVAVLLSHRLPWTSVASVESPFRSLRRGLLSSSGKQTRPKRIVSVQILHFEDFNRCLPPSCYHRFERPCKPPLKSNDLTK